MTTAPVPQTFSNLTGTPSASAVLTVPTGVAIGDVLLVGIELESTAAITPPAGFTQKQRLDCTGSDAHSHLLFWKRASAADTGTYTFSWTGSVQRAAWCARISGCVSSGDPFGTPLNTANSNSVGSSTVTPAITTFTPTVDNCLLVGSFTFRFGANITNSPPSGWTERIDNSWAIFFDTLSQTTKTASGAVTASSDQASNGRTAIVGYILPAGATISLTGSITPAGALTKTATKNFVGSITPAGAFAKIKVVTAFFSGAITPAGAITRSALKNFGGTLTPAGAFAKKVSKIFTGAITPAGSLIKRFNKKFTGSLTPSGAVSTTFLGRVFGKPGIVVMSMLRSSMISIRHRRG